MDVVHSCRCCLGRAPDKDLTTPYTHLGTKEIYLEMLKECFEIHLILDSDEEVGICDVCVGRLRDASDFKLQVQRSQARLQGALQDKAIKEETPAVESVMEDGDWTSEEHVLCAEVPIKVELRNEDEISDGERQELLDEERAVKAEVSDAASSDEDCIPPAWAAADSGATSRHGPRLASRMKDMPDDTAGLRAEEQAYTCDTCGEHFTDKSRLIDHVQAHITHADKLCATYSCITCSKEFSCINIYTKHVDTHTNSGIHKIKKYLCEICKKTYINNRFLKQHMMIHTGEKPFSCDECNRKFTRKDYLSTHKMIHTGVKPYSCKECNKQFQDKGNLNKHLRIHTGVKPYICNVCNKQFTLKHHLEAHKRTHTGEKPYSCNECDKQYTRKHNLDTHRRIHT